MFCLTQLSKIKWNLFKGFLKSVLLGVYNNANVHNSLKCASFDIF